MAAGAIRVRDHPLYNTWKKMRQRCRNRRATQYPYYGARGIRVCRRWRSFSAFVADMGWRPEGHTLDRIDQRGDYCPENCRWATKAQQNSNKSDTLQLELSDGRVVSGAEAARQLGIWRSSVYRQLKRRPDRLAERLRG
jgi:hypothetical protein